MDVYAQIREKLKTAQTQLFFVAKVVSVDGEVCNVDLDGLQLTDVQLRAVVNSENSKLLVTPKVGSYVLIADLSSGNKTRFVVFSCSEVEQIEIYVDGKIILNGGKNEGLVKIEELTDKLNALVDWCKNHKHSGVITAVSGGSGAPAEGTSGNSAAPTTQPATFSKNDYEDEKVKH